MFTMLARNRQQASWPVLHAVDGRGPVERLDLRLLLTACLAMVSRGDVDRARFLCLTGHVETAEHG